MEQFELNAQTRIITGRKVKKIRQAGNLPVVIYGSGIEPKLLTVNKAQFGTIYSKAGSSSLVKLMIDENKEPVNILLHDIVKNAYSDEIIHADFLQVKLTEKIKAEIPIILIGAEDAPVVKEKEGSIVLNKDSVEVEAFPQDLINEIEVNVIELSDFDQVIHVSDLVVDSKIKVLDDPEDVIVTIQEPRSEEELAELETEVVEDVEGVEVEEKGKEEELAEGETPAEQSEEPKEKSE